MSDDRELVHLDLGLRAFSEEPKCPKCDNGAITTTWHQAIIMQAQPPHPCETWVLAEMLTGVVGEHLCRRCTRCGYGWPERTADA